MNVEYVAENVIRVPFQMNELGYRSFISLLNDSGYFDHATLLNEDDIENALRKNPDAVREWMQYSDDKRVSSGPGIGYNEIAGTYYAGNDREKKIFSDKFKACAYYITLEIENARRRHNALQELRRTIDIKSIVGDIVKIPYKLSPTKSIDQILTDIDYFDTKGYINEDDIEGVLKEFPDAIEEWLKFSSDKHCGWFFHIDKTNNIYTISHFGNYVFMKNYASLDKFVVCALYIRLEIEARRIVHCNK